MKTVILTCTSRNPMNPGIPNKQRFVIEIDGLTGDAQIRDERAPHIERDRSAPLKIGVISVTLEVEAS